MTAQSFGDINSAGHPWGEWMFGSLSTEPASITCTLWPASTSLRAIALPADPAPTTM